MDTSDGPGKLEEVKELLKDLKDDLASGKLTEEDRFSTLEELKIHGRDPEGAEPLFEKENFDVVCKYALEGKSVKESREAFRVIANALLLKPETRKLFVDADGPRKMLQRPTAFETVDDEFLTSRILFLLTYGSNVDFNELIAEHDLDEKISQALERHVQPSGIKALPLVREMALAEILKLVFNITHNFPEAAQPLTICSAPILRLIKSTKPSPFKALQPPLTLMLNSMMALGLTLNNPGPLVVGDPESLQIAESLINILEEATAKQPVAELDINGVPLANLIHKMYDSGSPDLQLKLQTDLLPSENERKVPLGQSETLPARLLRLSAAAEAPNLGIALSFLLFTLSDSDPETFVRNVGFGFASGFLVNNRLPVPQAGGEGARSDVNFVTGQFLSEEDLVNINMTDEEKEREAERLFVLFERLRATGVVDVENPVTVAAREGRLEEIED